VSFVKVVLTLPYGRLRTIVGRLAWRQALFRTISRDNWRVLPGGRG